MGSIISLGVEQFELDWGKNDCYQNHSKLFLSKDTYEVDYYYADNCILKKTAYKKSLSAVIKRIELLGFTLSKIEKMYMEFACSLAEQYPKEIISFNDLKEIISSIDLSQLKTGEELYSNDFRRVVENYISCIAQTQGRFRTIYKLNDIEEFLGKIDSYILLRLLYENPVNRHLNVIWRYADVVEGGWVKKEEIYNPLLTKDKFLIVTEGSSDSFIIKESFERLYPEIADFFYFVDMADGYPFTGTGNLYKFCQGLTSIQLLNKVLFLYDNDVSGREKYVQSQKLTLSPNMGIMLLPSLQEFTEFRCIGPNGESIEDINGKAVSIECFLDLSYSFSQKAKVRWASFDSKSGKYQGAIENKDYYIREFKKNRNNSQYNLGKLEKLLRCIIEKCMQLENGF